MIMHAFGTGTASDQAVTVASATFRGGLSGIWYQWLWLFATPFLLAGRADLSPFPGDHRLRRRMGSRRHTDRRVCRIWVVVELAAGNFITAGQ